MGAYSTQEIFAIAVSLQGERASVRIEQKLCSNPRIPKPLALSIYRNNSLGAQVNALRAIYPVLEQILGEQCFKRMAHDYVREHPSNTADLNVYGEAFSGFIKQRVQDHAAFEELLYIFDLARLEWILNAAYYADDDVSQYDDLNMDANRVMLKISHAIGLMQTAYPVVAIWQAHKAGKPVAEIAALTETDYLVVYRDAFMPEVARIDREDWSLLAKIKQTISLRALAEFSIRMDLSLNKRLPLMIQRGWVVIK